MISVFAAAWRVIIKRTGADWLILAAATLIILLSTTLLAAGPIYAGAVTLSGLHRTLADAEVIDADVEISSRVRPEDYRSMNDRVAAEAGAAFAPTGASVERLGRSDSFALPGQQQDEVTDLAIFGFFDNLQKHATIVEGAWPAGVSSGPVGSVVSDSTAEQLGLTLGQELELVNRREPSFAVSTRIVGIYTVNDPLDPYWFQEPLEIGGVEVGESFTTFGPFVVSPEDFFGRTTYVSAEVFWRIFPTFANLTVSEVGPFRQNMDRFDGALNAGAASGQRFSIRSDLRNILREAERSLLVTRTGVMILTVQLAVLAGYALVLTAGLLIEQRRVETALLRSRGASNGQIAAMAFMEGLLLALPAAIIGPWVAAFSLRLLNVVGPLTSIDLELDPRVTTAGYLLSAISAVACVVALVLPAYLAARSFIDARASRGRQMTSGIAQRGGIDLALLVVAVIGYWQLRRYGAPITETVQGRLGLDPFLVAAPAIGLLAGAVVALRVIPLLAKAIERGVSNGRSVVTSLGAWQVARRPLRYTRSALLLMLALAIGLFAVSYTRTWTNSQRDQADYQVGADMRVKPDQRTGRAIPQYTLANAYQQVEGIEEPMPVIRNSAVISRSAGTGRVVAVDAATAPDVVIFRPDLAENSLSSMMDQLVASRPQLPLINLPGEPQRIALDVSMTLAALPDGAPPEADQSIQPSMSIVVSDARGMLYRISGGPLEPDNGPQRLIFDLAHDLGDQVATPEYPVSIVSIETRMLIPYEYPRDGRIDVTAIQTSASLEGDDWQRVDTDRNPANWQFSNSLIGGLAVNPTVASAEPEPDGSIALTFQTGATAGSNALLPLTYSIKPTGDAPGATTPITAVVTDSFLAETEAAVGDELQVDVAGARRPLVIVDSVSAFPTVDPEDGPALIIDLPTFAALQFQTSGRIDGADEWWIAVDNDEVEGIAATLGDAPYSSWKIDDRFTEAELLRTDPVALGIIGALSLGFVSAALFAVIGFVVSAAVSAHERLTEFSLLRALGLSPRQLSGWLSLENGLLVLISLVGGTALGLLMAWMVLPFVTLTQDASAVVPDIIVAIPWSSILLLEALTIGALAIVVLALAILLRRVGLGTVLRLGEE